MATAAKAAEEAKAAGRRAAAAGANRDEVALALNATRTELGLVAAQYQQVRVTYKFVVSTIERV